MKNVTRPYVSLSLICLFSLSLASTARSAPASAGVTLAGHVEAPGHIPAPGARVVLIDVRTRQRKITWTDETGAYHFTNVSPGTYALFISLIGFRPNIIRPFAVQSGSKQNMDVSLQLALPGEQTRMAGVWVRNRAARDMATRGKELPMGPETVAGVAGMGAIVNKGMSSEGNGGLRFSQGAAAGEQTGGEATDNPSLQLSASADNSFLLTGNVVNAPAPEGNFRGKRMIMMKGQMMTMGGGIPGAPGFGGGGPGFAGGGGPVILFAGPRRAKVNQLRGMLFDTYTNSALDARPYPLNVPESPQIPSYSERAGISLGGPLVIPKIYNGLNKTSFFVHYMMVRSKSPFDSFATVPTPAERLGDFSNTVIPSGPLAGTTPTIYQPFTGTPFPGNQIPETMINPASKALLAYIPLPNLPGQVQNFHLQESLPAAQDVVMGRIGQQFSSKDNLSVFYFLLSSRTNSVSSFPELTSHTSTLGQNLNVIESHTLDPHTVNIMTANFNRQRISLLNPFAFTQNIAGDLGIQGVSQNPMDWGIPLINFTNFTSLNDTIPSLTRNQTLRFSDFAIITRGNHNLHVGGEIRFVQVNTLTDPGARGSFTFSGYTTSAFSPQGVPANGTGFDFADFLLGFPQTTSARFGSSANYLRSRAYDAFADDDWRFSQHLTFDLGLRYEYFAPFTEKYGHLSDLALGQDYSTAGVITAQNPGNLPASLIHGQAYNWSPRLGIAYRPWVNHSLVVRAGYGIFYDGGIYQQLATNLVDQPPFATASTLLTSPTQLLTLQNGFPVVGPNVVRNTYAVDPNFLTPYAQTWDVMLEQQLADNTILSVAYVGTRGTHLNLLLAPNLAAAGSPAAGQGNLLLENTQPFIYDTSGASSIYHGLRVGLRRLFHGGLAFYADYTYSKAMDNAASVGSSGNTAPAQGPLGLLAASFNPQGASAGAGGPIVAQNPFNLQAEWGLSNFNPTHQFLVGYHYRLPFGDHRHFLNHGGKLARIFGRWEVSGFTTVESGTPYTALVLGNLSNNVNGAAPFNSLRANVTGLPVSLPGSAQTTLEFFNTAAFTLPAAGQYGNAGRDTIPGPGLVNFDTSIDRLLTISREKGINADVRLSANNLLNTPNFTGLATTVNAADFGRVTSVGSMRTLSLTMRLRF